MTYQSRLGILLLLMAVPAVRDLQGQAATTKAAVFRTSSQMVLVPVTVTDHSGKTVEGLRASDFYILDDQKPQQIVSFSNEDAPCSVGIVLDTSGSMRKALGGAKEIAHSFLGTANPQDEFLLLTVSTEPASVSTFTTNIGELDNQIDATQSGGMTALVDTVYFGLSRMRESRHPRRALLIVSDGMENNSRYSAGELMRVALEADVQVYTILVDGISGGTSSAVPFRPRMAAKPWDRGPEQQGPEMLEKLSEKTGGLHFRVHNATEAKQAMANASRAIRNLYVIGYQAPDSNQTGKWHRVRVKANLQKVNVYARNGYYEH